jgi:hypothetical protein
VLSWTCQPRLFTRSGGGEEALGSDLWIADAGGREIQAYAREAKRHEPVQFGIGGLVVDYGHAPRVISARRHAIDRRGIIRAVHASRHDHHALDFQCLVEYGHFFRQRRLGRIGAPRKPWKLRRIAMDMRVAIARARRNIEIDVGRRLGCLGVAETRLHQHAGGSCAEHEFATSNHGGIPYW